MGSEGRGGGGGRGKLVMILSGKGI